MGWGTQRAARRDALAWSKPMSHDRPTLRYDRKIEGKDTEMDVRIDANLREQQGADWGHFWLSEQVGMESARTLVALMRATPRGMRDRTMVAVGERQDRSSKFEVGSGSIKRCIGGVGRWRRRS